MKHKTIMLLLLILLSRGSFAHPVIHQVIYDPLNTESGGEMIQLYNPGDSINLSDYTIGTSASAKDVVFTTQQMQANTYFIIADKGWNVSKDNESYPSADLEEIISMRNSDSGIALFFKGEQVDALGWGEDPLYSQGSPAVEVSPGNALLRINSTGDNAIDFIEHSPFSTTVLALYDPSLDLQLEVLDPDFNFTVDVPDEDEQEGIQWLPFPGQLREIPIGVQGNNITGFALFNNQEFPFVHDVANISLPYSVPPGEYPLEVIVEKNNLSQTSLFIIEVLPVLALNLDTTTINFGMTFPGKDLIRWGDQTDTTTDKPTVQNIGNVLLDIGLSGTDLVSEYGIINVSHISVSFDNDFTSETSSSLFYTKQIIDINLNIDEILPLSLRISVPSSAIEGVYQGTVYLTGVFGE